MAIAMVAFLGRVLRRGALPISHLPQQHVFLNMIKSQPTAADVCLDMTQLSKELKDKSPPSCLASNLASSTDMLDEKEHIPEKPSFFKRHYRWIIFFFLAFSIVLAKTIPLLDRRTKRALHLPLWKWELLFLALFFGRLVSGWVVHVGVFLLERAFFLRKKLLYLVYGLRNAVKSCIFFGLVLVIWKYAILYKHSHDAETQRSRVVHYTSKVLFFLLLASLLQFGKTLAVKVLALSFHMTNYFDRIQDALFNQFLIQSLSAPPLIDLQSVVGGRSFEPSSAGRKKKKNKKKKKKKNKKVISRENTDSSRLGRKNASAWSVKKLMNMLRYGSQPTLDEEISDSSGEDESVVQIQTEREASAAAEKIFHHVAKPGSDYIHTEDLMRFMEEDKALKAMLHFAQYADFDQENKVDRIALTKWGIDAFKERKALALTLHDTNTAVNCLNRLLNAVMVFADLILLLLMMDITTPHLIMVWASGLLLLVFIFGDTMKTVFQAIVFLFAVHPFDVGDKCEVDGVQMIVEEMNILTTVFVTDDRRRISYPNSVLMSKAIGKSF